MKEKLQASADKITLVTLNGKNGNCDFMGDLKIRGLNNIYELKFYGGNEFNGKTFDKMCDSESLSRLGILRMDVDNLGNIFQTGILPEMSTLSRSALSLLLFSYLILSNLNSSLSFKWRRRFIYSRI